MSRNHKLEKIRKLSDEVDELGQRRSGISQESVEGLQELAEIQGHVRHKQDQIAKLFRQVERNELNALVQRLKQNKK